MASLMVAERLYEPSSRADPSRTGSGVCEVIAGPGWAAAALVKGTARPTPANVKNTAANPGHSLEPRTLMLIAPFASHNASQLAPASRPMSKISTSFTATEHASRLEIHR